MSESKSNSRSWSESPELVSEGEPSNESKLIKGGKSKFEKVSGVLLLNCSMAGLQFAFAISSTVITPYLDALGMTQSEESLINLIGPICGFIIQPIFGALSDTCTFKWGRRRLFILIGAISTLVALALVGYSYEMSQSSAVIIAIIGVVLLNISLNIMMAPARAIVSDLVSEGAQNRGQVFAAFMMGASFLICNFIVYGLTYILDTSDMSDIPAIEEQCGDVLSTADLALIICTVGIVFIGLMQIPTMVFGKEKRFEHHSDVKEPFIFVRMAKQIKHMPRNIAMVCIVFLGSWAGYYPFQMFCSVIYGMQLGALSAAVGNTITLVYSIVLDKIVGKFRERKCYIVSQGMSAVAMVLMLIPYYGNYDTKWGLNKDEDDEQPVNLRGLSSLLRRLDDPVDPIDCDGVTEPSPAWVQVVVCILVGIVGINNATMNSIPFSIIGKTGGEAKGLYMGILNCCCVIAQVLGILTNLLWTLIFPDPTADGSPVTDENKGAHQLSQMGPIVACALYGVIAFGLTFILKNPPTPEERALLEAEEKRRIEEEDLRTSSRDEAGGAAEFYESGDRLLQDE